VSVLAACVALVCARGAVGSGVVISEFMAINDTTLRDADGDFSDWIEIHNGAPTNVSLEGWHLTDRGDNLTRWSFPATNLVAGGFIVVFASNKDRGVAGRELHTDFKLSGGGEYLALVAPDGVTIATEFAPTFPVQYADMSYGSNRYYAVATPGGANASGFAGVSAEVEFSRAGGMATNAFTLELSSAASNAVITYTLDQSAPGPASSVYSTPLAIAGTTLVRARAYEPGKYESGVRSEIYLFLAPDVQAFTSDIPIMVVDNLGLGNMPSAEPKQKAVMAIIEPREGVCALSGEVSLATRIAARRRGESSLRPTDRKPNLAIETHGELDDDSDVAPFGMPADSDWILHAPYGFDRALMRNALIFELSNRVGVYACRTRFCEVFLNSGGGALTADDYAGVYIFMERVKRGNDRVDVERLDPLDSEAPDITGGYIFKIDKPDPGKTAWSAGGQGSMYYVYPPDADITPAQSTWLRGYIDAFGGALNGAGFADPVSGYRAYFDTAPSIDHHILNLLSKNVDGLRLSTFIHKPREGKLTYGPIWDFDRSMESTDGRDDAWNTWDAPNGTRFFDYGWWNRLFQDADFWQDWIDRWQALRDGELSTTNIHTVIDGMSNQLVRAQARNFQQWTAVPPRNGWGWEVDHLKEWLALRADWVDGHLIARPAFDLAPGAVSAGVALTVTAPSNTTLYCTLDGSDPRAAGGGVAPGALELTSGDSITIDRNVIVRARATDGSVFGTGPNDCPWSGLTEAVYVVSEPTLAVSEVMYHPREPVGVETNGGYAERHYEFIEIQNIGPERVELVGVQFTNGIAFDFTFSTVRSLAPNEYAVVVDELGAFTNRYPNWRDMNVAGEFALDLSDTGERVELRSATGKTLASFRYNDARGWPTAADGAGHSLVPLRLFDQDSGSLDYGRHWRASAYIDGSPGAADPLLPATVALNEFMAHTDYSGGPVWQDSDDWIELYNASGEAVGLGGWYLSDDRDALAKWAIPEEHTLASGEWIGFSEVLDFHTTQTNGFGLNKAGEEIYLSHLPDGGRRRVADCVRFKGQENGVSLGRSPDGGEFWHALTPTAGGANASPSPHVRIDEVMYHPVPTLANPENNTNDEYIEVHNPRGHAVPLSTEAGSWRVDGGVSFVFPSNTILAAGERVLVVGFDPATNVAAVAAFGETYGDLPVAARLFGPYSGSLDNVGERIAIERPQLGDVQEDEVSWVIVDEVIYFDQSPWPSRADGMGDCLERLDGTGAGRDPDQWGVWAPSPGAAPAGIYLHGIDDRAAYFGPVGAVMSVDVSAITAEVNHVDFMVDTNLLCRDTAWPFECPLTDLTNAGTYSCAAVAATGSGSYTSQTVRINVLAFDTPFVLSVSDVGATVNGALRGASPAYVRLYWGREDGGTDAGMWEHVQNLGSVSNTLLEVPISGLSPGVTFYFRFYGSVGSDSGWGARSSSFCARTLADWPRRMSVRFDGYGGASVLTNFPVLVRLGAHIDGFDYSSFGSASGYDLRFMDDALTEALSYDVETWDTNGTSCVWVRVPELDPGCRIWTYWGAAGITSPPPYAVDGSTWSEGFEGVWHFDGSLTDATAGRIAAEDFGSSPTGGVVGLGRAFDGNSAHVVPDIPLRWYEEHRQGATVSLWSFPYLSREQTVFGTRSAVGDAALFVQGDLFRGVMCWRFGVGAVDNMRLEASRIADWQHVALVLGNGAPRGLYDGGSPVTIASGDSYTFEDKPFLGAMNRGGVAENFFSGQLDELRISGVARCDDWLLAEYQTAAPNSVFAAYEVMAARPADSDGDGMADTWEDRHFGGTNIVAGAPDADWDGDGIANAGEYAAGTDPTNAASCFRLSVELRASGNVRLSFRSVEAIGDYYSGLTRYYDLLRSEDLTDSAWHGVSGYTNILGDGSDVVYANRANGGYYRGRARLE